MLNSLIPFAFRISFTLSDGMNTSHILPFKTNAQFQIDSFVGYEVNVYKDILYNEFLRMKDSYELYSRFADMEKVLEQSVALDESLVPHNSLIREFIG